ncbi:MAG: VIT domain-containing protein, partial [Acidobacteriota bacterium]
MTRFACPALRPFRSRRIARHQALPTRLPGPAGPCGRSAGIVPTAASIPASYRMPAIQVAWFTLCLSALLALSTATPATGGVVGRVGTGAVRMGDSGPAISLPAPPETMPVDEVDRPGRRVPPRIRPGGDPASRFLLTATDVQTTISGPVAHVIVSQRWNNPNTLPVDGVYIFPLPEDAAVSDMSLRIGERRLAGRMMRREEARAVYEQARAAGKVAGLLDEERPNIFAQQVANLMPGMAIDVVIEFDQPITCEDADCAYVFPTVVGPRFIPATMMDPGQIDPPVVAPGAHTPQRLTLSVDLDAGVTMRDLTSPSHRITITRQDDARAHVQVAEGADALLDRDFRLHWAVGGARPELGVLTWRDPARPDEPGVFSLLIQPPAQVSDEAALPRELVFVLDCSGSMSGVPLEAAKNVVRHSLAAVRPGDTFQILRFSENASGLGTRPLTPTPANLQRALIYLDGLSGQGGTQMLAGIHAALDPPRDPERLRIVAFLTDGYIGNERSVLAAVQQSIGEARLFAFGIGSSVNRYLLEGLAEEGRGMAAFLGPREEPDAMVERFVRRIDTPVLTDIRLHFDDVEVTDLEPAIVPDLFAGQSVLVHGRYTRPGTGLVEVEGNVRGRSEILSRVLVLPEREPDTAALGRLWARARIHRLARQLHAGARDDVKESIVQLGLRHHLMTAWTSLVAVDSVVSNATGQSSQVRVPVEMPEDVSYEGIFGIARAGLQSAAKTAVASVSAGRMQAAPVPVRRVDMAAPAQERGRKAGGKFWRAADAPDPAAGETGTATGKDRDEKSRRESDSRATSIPFTRIVLVTVDGVRVEIEDDGEVWVMNGARRTLITALDEPALDRLRQLLGRARATAWPVDAGHGARLVLVTSAGRFAVSLPVADGPAAEIVAWLSGW